VKRLSYSDMGELSDWAILELGLLLLLVVGSVSMILAVAVFEYKDGGDDSNEVAVLLLLLLALL